MHRVRWVLVAASALLALPPASAQDAAKPAKPGENSLGNAASDAPILTRDALRACLEQQERLQKQSSDAIEQQRRLDDEKTQIGRRRSELDEALLALDRSSQPAVDAHNALTAELDARISAYNARSAPFNARAEGLNAERRDWQRDCATRRYREDDMLLIKARK